MSQNLSTDIRYDNPLTGEIQRWKETIENVKPNYSYSSGRKFVGKLRDGTQLRYTLNQMVEGCTSIFSKYLKFADGHSSKMDYAEYNRNFQAIESIRSQLEQLDQDDEKSFYSDPNRSRFLKVVVWIRQLFGNLFSRSRRDILLIDKVYMLECQILVSRLCKLELYRLEIELSAKKSEIDFYQEDKLNELDRKRNKYLCQISPLTERDFDLRDHNKEIEAAKTELATLVEGNPKIAELENDIAAWTEADEKSRVWREQEKKIREGATATRSALQNEADSKVQQERHNTLERLKGEKQEMERKIKDLEQFVYVADSAVELTSGLPSNSYLDRIAQRVQEAANTNEFFKVFGLSSSYGQEDLRKEYRKLAVRVHPDKNPDARERAEEIFKHVNNTYAKCIK